MTEKRFLVLSFMEGVLLTVLGLCVLILPKLTSLTFGVMLSAAFTVCGLYKIIETFINKVKFASRIMILYFYFHSFSSF